MNPSELEELKILLTKEKERLEGELSSFALRDPKMEGDWDTVFPKTTGLPSPLAHASQEEQADLREEFETETAQEHTLESRLQEVNRAIERMREGTFGQCRACGLAISAERLYANPAAEYDMAHQPRE